MVTTEDLQAKYTKLKDEDLIQIVISDGGYTPLAVDIAHQELSRRGIAKDDIRAHKHLAILQDNLDKEIYLDDLKWWHKLIFYFAVIVHLKFRYKKYLVDDGQLLGDQQANYYMVAGAIFLAAGLIADTGLNLNFFWIWIGGFVATFLFDIQYNRQRQKDDIEKRVVNKKPWTNFTMSD